MRFAISSPTGKLVRFSRNPADWPLSLHFVVMTVPVGICIALAALWLGYRSSSAVLMESLEALPLLEAKSQATRMGDTLEEMRNSLSTIAQSRNISEDVLRDSMRLSFQGNTELVRELSYKHEHGGGFLLLRENGSFTAFPLPDASSGPYSPLQQASSVPPQKNRATLYPPVYYDDSGQGSHAAETRVPVMRMSMLTEDGLGTLVLGIDLAGLRHRLAKPMLADSSLRLPHQEGAMQLSFFFDTRGWILFEMDNSGSDSYLPDIAREGYTGDLGRAGYDVAFRPWAMHENFWRMVTEISSGRAGSIPAPADKYTAAHVGSTGLLCFAPVMFAQARDTAPAPVGGIAFFETSALPLNAFLRLANYFLVVVVVAAAAFALLAVWLNRRLGKPLSRMAEDMNGMTKSGTLDFLDAPTGCEEQQQFQSAVNSIIAGAMSTRNDLDHITREVHQARSRQPVELDTLQPAPQAEPDFGLIGSSALIREVREHVRKAARAGTDVLVWGETGTGKELVAAAIHKASTRSEGPYISINCGALDENLLLDALFGHVKGAFTEARSDRKGAFLAADGGTLHLDEIANASLKVQQSLLRALSVRRIRLLGTDEEIPFNTRVVAATNVDLRECVRAGTFREDLYYRLAIISIETPPLRHRKEDIPELASFCIRDAANALGRPEARLSRGALDLMAAHDWPGNVREFKNCLTRAMAFVEGDLILRQHITLEQDAFRTYAKPIAPKVLAEKIHSPDKTAVADKPVASGAPALPSAAQRPFGPAVAADGTAESLWPPPPRDLFTPAREGLSPEQSAETIAVIWPPARQQPAPEAPRPGNGGAEAAPKKGNGSQRAGARPAASGLDPALMQGLNERQLKALAFVHEHGGLTRSEYESVAGQDLSTRTAQNDLRELVERGILRRVGAGPGTRYTMTA